jgi:V/A-type H+-transporting ATPase subunit C
MADNYIYAVTRIHIREQNLLNNRDIDSLILAKSLNECLAILSTKNWNVQNTDIEEIINEEYEKAWALVSEVAGEIPDLNVLRISRDYHNLKAAIKLVYTGEPNQNWSRYFLPHGIILLKDIVNSVETREFQHLPKGLAEAGEKAWRVLCDTGNGQLCEIEIDRACLTALYAEGQASSSQLLREYSAFIVDTANIRAAVRCQILGKPRDFIELVIAQTGTLNIEEFITAASGEEFDLARFLENTRYAGAVHSDTPAAFERFCADKIIEMIKPQLKSISGIEPLVAYLLARENEISMVRIILSSKTCGLSEGAVRERLGRTYV